MIAPETPLEPLLLESLKAVAPTLTHVNLVHFDPAALCSFLVFVLPACERLDRLEVNLCKWKVVQVAEAYRAVALRQTSISSLKTLIIGTADVVPPVISRQLLNGIRLSHLSSLTIHIGAGPSTQQEVFAFIILLLEENKDTLRHLRLDNFRTCPYDFDGYAILMPLIECPRLEHLTLLDILFDAHLFTHLPCKSCLQLEICVRDAIGSR